VCACVCVCVCVCVCGECGCFVRVRSVCLAVPACAHCVEGAAARC